MQKYIQRERQQRERQKEDEVLDGSEGSSGDGSSWCAQQDQPWTYLYLCPMTMNKDATDVTNSLSFQEDLGWTLIPTSPLPYCLSLAMGELLVICLVQLFCLLARISRGFLFFKEMQLLFWWQ